MAQFFVTENYLKTQGYFNKNIDTQLYMNLIEGVAKSFLPSQIGTHFFDDLLTKYNAQTLSSDEQIVVSLMQKAISNRLKAEVVIEATLQLTNKGIQFQDSDNSTSVGIKEIGLRTDGLLSRAMQYESEIADWLTNNKDLYPEFTSADNKDSRIKNACCNGGSNYNEGQSFLII